MRRVDMRGASMDAIYEPKASAEASPAKAKGANVSAKRSKRPPGRAPAPAEGGKKVTMCIAIRPELRAKLRAEALRRAQAGARMSESVVIEDALTAFLRARRS